MLLVIVAAIIGIFGIAILEWLAGYVLAVGAIGLLVGVYGPWEGSTAVLAGIFVGLLVVEMVRAEKEDAENGKGFFKPKQPKQDQD